MAFNTKSWSSITAGWWLGYRYPYDLRNLRGMKYTWIYIYIWIFLKSKSLQHGKIGTVKSVMVNHQTAGHVDPFCISIKCEIIRGYGRIPSPQTMGNSETRKLSMAIYLEKYIPESNALAVDHLKQTTYIILHLMFNLCSNNNGKTWENKAVRSGKIHKCCLSKTRSIGYHLVVFAMENHHF